jgi:hypothetical protein
MLAACGPSASLSIRTCSSMADRRSARTASICSAGVVTARAQRSRILCSVWRGTGRESLPGTKRILSHLKCIGDTVNAVARRVAPTMASCFSLTPPQTRDRSRWAAWTGFESLPLRHSPFFRQQLDSRKRVLLIARSALSLSYADYWLVANGGSAMLRNFSVTCSTVRGLLK